MRHEHSLVANDVFQIQLIDECTVAIKVDHDVEFEIDDAKRVCDAVQQLSKGEKLYHLIIFGERTVPSPEARQFLISEAGCELKHAEAIIAHSLSQKMVFDFMINIERPFVRTKLFNSELEAYLWLQSLRN